MGPDYRLTWRAAWWSSEGFFSPCAPRRSHNRLLLWTLLCVSQGIMNHHTCVGMSHVKDKMQWFSICWRTGMEIVNCLFCMFVWIFQAEIHNLDLQQNSGNCPISSVFLKLIFSINFIIYICILILKLSYFCCNICLKIILFILLHLIFVLITLVHFTTKLCFLSRKQ